MSDPDRRKDPTPAATMQPATRVLDAGLVPDPVTGAIAPNLVASVNNTFTPGAAGFSAEGADLTEQPFLYARWTNPTTRALEERLAGLEGGFLSGGIGPHRAEAPVVAGDGHAHAAAQPGQQT